MVENPGAENSDPDDWAEFFGQFGHVTFVTVAKDNGPLLKACVISHNRDPIL